MHIKNTDEFRLLVESGAYHTQKLSTKAEAFRICATQGKNHPVYSI